MIAYLVNEYPMVSLTFIRRGRELGFSLDQIRELLGLVRGHDLTCAEVKAMTEEHVTDIRRKVKDLRKLERVLGVKLRGAYLVLYLCLAGRLWDVCDRLEHWREAWGAKEVVG